MFRTKSISIEAEDMDLANLADTIDQLVADTCASLESQGFEVVPPLAVFPVGVSKDVSSGTDYRDRWIRENGVIAVISYRKR